jgi:hypothetical protein
MGSPGFVADEVGVMVLVILLALEHDQPDRADRRLADRQPARSERVRETRRAAEGGTRAACDALVPRRVAYFLIGSALGTTRRASRSTAASFSSFVTCE